MPSAATKPGHWAASPSLTQTFNKILDNFSRVFTFTSTCVFLDEIGFLRVIAQRNHPYRDDLIGMRFPYAGNLLVKQLIQTGQPLRLADAQQDPRFEKWADAAHVRGWMALPLVVAGRVIGLICVDSEQVNAYSEQDLHLAQAFADQAAVAVEKAQLAEDLKREKRNLELLSRLSQTLSHSLNLFDVAESALRLTTAAFPACTGAVAVYAQDTQQFSVLAISNCPRQQVQRRALHMGLDAAPCLEQAFTDGAPAFFCNPQEIARLQRLLHRGQAATSAVAVPAVAVPLAASNENVGMLLLFSRHKAGLHPAQTPTLQSLATPIALAMQNARLYAEEHSRRIEAETLRTAISALTLDLSMEEILQEVLRRLGRVVAFDSSSVMLWEGEKLRVVAGMGFPEPEQVIGQIFSSHSRLFMRLQTERQPIFLDDARKDPHFLGWGKTGYVRGWMGVPLLHRNQLIGYITLDSRQQAAYGQAEAALAQAFASQAAVTIVNAQLIQVSQRTAVEQQEVGAIVHALNATASPPDLLRAMTPGLSRLMGCDSVELALYRRESGRVSGYWSDAPAAPCDSAGPDEPLSVQPRDYPMAASSGVRDVLAGQILLTSDLLTDPSPVESQRVKEGFRARVCVPLEHGSSSIGHVQLFWHTPDQYPTYNISHLGQIADAVALALAKLELLEETQQRANSLAVLTELSGLLRVQDKTADVMGIALDYALGLFRGDRGRISVPTDDPNFLRVALQMGNYTHLVDYNYPLNGSLVGQVYRTGKPHVARNIFDAPGAHRRSVQDWQAEGYQRASALFAPLRTKKGIIGVLSVVACQNDEPYNESDLGLFAAIAEVIGNALYRATILETLEQRVLDRTQELASANERLQELDELKNHFVANVSHELRTPLTNIKLYLDLLHRGRREKRGQYMQVLAEEANRLEELVESILSLSRLQAAPTIQLFRPEMLDLHQLAADVVQNQQARTESQHIHLQMSDASQRVRIRVDRSQITQLVTNLVTNAVNYTPAGGRVNVSVSRFEDETGQGWARLAVQDTGIGIPESEQDRLFDRFYRGSQTRDSDIPGTGLGLSIAQEVVEQHNGKISVTSQVGNGSTFQVDLPLHTAQPNKKQPPSSQPVPPALVQKV